MPNYGLSPPTRGNHDVGIDFIIEGWSIPAHAGEPLRKPCQ